MWSASALKHNCAHPNVLNRGREPTPAAQESMDRGNIFHKAMEAWIRTGKYPDLEDMEIQGWVDAFAAQWSPTPWVKVEIAWGLGEDGQHLAVEEPEPHKYAAKGGLPLLTAGRADLVYAYRKEGILYIVDYKTGKSAVEPAPTNLQVNAAGLALADAFGARGYIPGVYLARDAAFDWGDPVEMGSAAAEDVFESVKAAALLPETPIPGDHCSYCWEMRKKTCSSAQR